MATHSGILAWSIPWTEEPGGLQSVGLQRSRHDYSDLACTHAQVLTACGISFPDQESKPNHLHSECGLLATGPPGMSHNEI